MGDKEKKAEDRRLKEAAGNESRPMGRMAAAEGGPTVPGMEANGRMPSAPTGNNGMGQRIDINVLFRRLGEKDFLLDQATQALGMAQQQCAAMDERIKELEGELKKVDRPKAEAGEARKTED